MRLLLVLSAVTLLLRATGLAQSARPPVDLIITHAHVVTMNDRRTIIEDGAVIISDSRIVAVGRAAWHDQYPHPRLDDGVPRPR